MRLHPQLLTSLWVQTLKDLAQVLEVDKRSKLEAECPEFGMSGASAYLALAGGDYNLAREELLAVHQRFKAQVGSFFMSCLLVCLLYIAAATFLFGTNSLSLFLQAPICSHP